MDWRGGSACPLVLDTKAGQMLYVSADPREEARTMTVENTSFSGPRAPCRPIDPIRLRPTSRTLSIAAEGKTT